MALTLDSPRSWEASLTWRADASCLDVDTNLFFPIGVTGPAVPQIETAKEICGGCPVRAECLAFAIETNQEFGIWGGTTEDERRSLRRKWRAEQRRRAS